MDPQRSKEKGVVSRHDRAKLLASVLGQEQAGYCWSKEGERSRVSEGDGEEPSSSPELQ